MSVGAEDGMPGQIMYHSFSCPLELTLAVGYVALKQDHPRLTASESWHSTKEMQ